MFSISFESGSLFLVCGFFILSLLSKFDVFMHELGHCIGITISNHFNQDFTDKVTYQIYYSDKCFLFIGGFTKSNYLKFLSRKDNRVKYSKHIKWIALSGVLFSCLLYLVFGVVFFLLSLIFPVCIYGLLAVGFLMLRNLASFLGFASKHSDFKVMLDSSIYDYNAMVKKFHTNNKKNKKSKIISSSIF